VSGDGILPDNMERSAFPDACQIAQWLRRPGTIRGPQGYEREPLRSSGIITLINKILHLIARSPVRIGIPKHRRLSAFIRGVNLSLFHGSRGIDDGGR
jgi:hypothetical protein